MWKKINVVFILKSPLHIGYLPFKGSVVSPTRYYVPGRNFWGAITKILTEHLYQKPKSNNYREIGKQVIDNFRFSYFYLYDGKTIYLPRYIDDGLVYGDDSKKTKKAEFEHRFIGSRVSTAIDGSSGTAKDGSLHEIEFIHNKFKKDNGKIEDTKIAGIIWFKNNSKINGNQIKKTDSGIFINNFDIIEELILGGESKYGFGHVLLDSVDTLKFPIEVEEGEIKININESVPLPTHLRYNKDINFNGDIELITGRGYFAPKKSDRDGEIPGNVISKPEYYFSPGTIIKKDISVEINWDGTLDNL